MSRATGIALLAWWALFGLSFVAAAISDGRWFGAAAWLTFFAAVPCLLSDIARLEARRAAAVLEATRPKQPPPPDRVLITPPPVIQPPPALPATTTGVQGKVEFKGQPPPPTELRLDAPPSPGAQP